MQDQEAKKVAQEVANILNARRSLDETEHKDHHVFLRAWIKKMEQRRLFWEPIRKQVVGWGIIAILSGIGVAVADYFEWIFKGHS